MIGRKINFFEKMLLPVGVGLTILGLYLILSANNIGTEVVWLKLCAIFLWMILLFNVVQSSITEDMKEELGLIQQEHTTEIKLLKSISNEQLHEIRLLNEFLKSKKK